MPQDSLFPTSFAQRRLWFIQNMSPASTAYNMMFPVELPFVPDVAALRGALNEMVARHEVLRTSFIFKSGEPLQVVAVHGELPLTVHDLRRSAADAEQEFTRLSSACVSEPFDLSSPPLARAHLGLLGDSHSRLVLVLHHIIVDERSIRILAEELDEIYRARVSGQLAILPELPVQYADYSDWQRRFLSGRRLEKLTDYWVRRLEGLDELALHHDGVRPRGGSVRGSLQPFVIPPDVVRGLRALAAGSGTTLFATLLAGFAVMLGRFTGQTALAIGTPVSGRPRAELQRVVGLFVNSVVLRVDISGDPTFQELVNRTSLALAEDLSHQEFPFELLVDALNSKRRADRNPIFQVMFQLQVLEGSQRRGGGGGGGGRKPSGAARNGHAHLEPDAVTSQLDLSFIQYEAEGGQVQGGAVYASALFEPATVKQFVEAYVQILTDAWQRPSARISKLRALGESGRREVLALGEGEWREWHNETLLHQLFAQQAEASPDVEAVVAEDGALTFAQLDARSDLYDAALRRMGVGPGRAVAICLPRGTELVAAILGVLKAGGHYVWLDASAPRRRLEFIISDCETAVVIVQREGEALAFGRPCLFPEDVATAASHVSENPPEASADLPAYLIYTSGSTGEPKGVMISHRAIVNHMRWMLERFPLGAGDRVLQRTPLSFDASVWELHAPLLSGATLVLAPEERLFDPARLLELIARQRITTLQVVPSLLRALINHGELGKCRTLKRVFCGGEALTADVRDAFFQSSSATLCNLYGPTETTIDATFHVCAPEDRRPFVPIGRPISNVLVRVLDEQGEPVPPGMPGELYIGGLAIGIGYVNRPELTAERFIPDPYAPGGRLFRTGDRVRMLACGELQFLGRMDEQVKLRGFRIELGEVEAVLSLHPSVREAAVVVREQAAGDQRLQAYVVPTDDGAANLTFELRRWLRERLPDYSIPSLIEVRALLPKTAHGKLDRKALAQSPVSDSIGEGERVAPRDALERDICRCFRELLGRDEIGIDDDFFYSGGHSLLVIPLTEKLATATGQEITIVDIFEYPTPRQLAIELKARAKDSRVKAAASSTSTLFVGSEV